MRIYDERVTRGVARMKEEAVITMSDMVERAARYDVDLATQAATYLVTFMRRMPWAHRTDGPDPNTLVTGPVSEGEVPFGRYLVIPIKDPWRPTDGYAAWFPEDGSLVVYSTFDARQMLAGAVLFHELFHAHDGRLKEEVNRRAFEDGRFPAESDAWRFMSQVLNAVLGGRYLEEIQRLADLEMKGGLRAFRHQGLILPAMNPKFLRLFSPKMPDTHCVNALMAQVQYDLAYELIGRRSGEEAESRRALLYTQFLQAVKSQAGSPELTAFARDFVHRW